MSTAAPRVERRPEWTAPAVAALVAVPVVVVLDHGHHVHHLAVVAGLAALLVLLTVLWQRERRASADLRRQQRHFRSLLRSSPDRVLILDERLRVSWADPRIVAMLGHGPDELVGRRLEPLIHPDDLPTLVALSGIAPVDRIAVRTARVRHADGSWLLVEATVRDLRADPAGVRIAVDDFGTGWSSPAYLVGMPVDVLKMDQHFLADVEDDPQARALCRGVLQLGTSLGLTVVVEGVTTDGQLSALRDMGHRYLQGYVFSRPLEVDGLRADGWRACAGAPVAAP